MSVRIHMTRTSKKKSTLFVHVDWQPFVSTINICTSNQITLSCTYRRLCQMYALAHVRMYLEACSSTCMYVHVLVHACTISYYIIHVYTRPNPFTCM